MVSPQTLAVQDDHLNYESLHNLKAAPGTAAMDPTAGTMFKNMNRFRSFDYLASIPSKASELPGMAVDLRRLTTNELADLYRSSHVFLFPSRGEGWGLTLSDALASGLPSIWTHNTAPVDYTGPEFGYPLTRLTFRDFGTVRGPNGLGLPCFCSEPDEREIIEKLEEIISDYPTAVAKGRKASEHMHMNYSWAKAGERLAEILEGVLAHSLG
jgi:glycosyltransferase involved in cell wall biosynthesis